MKTNPNSIYNNALTYSKRSFKWLGNKLITYINRSMSLFNIFKYRHETLTIRYTENSPSRIDSSRVTKKLLDHLQHLSPEATEQYLKEFGLASTNNNAGIKIKEDKQFGLLQIDYSEEIGFKLGSNRKEQHG